MTHKHASDDPSDKPSPNSGRFSAPKDATSYRVGIDVGLNSVGLSAIEIAPKGSLENPDYFPLYSPPLRLLSTQSVIHDSGVDPYENKTGTSRKATAGVARRSHRLRKQYRRRLRALDLTLTELGYPIAKLDSTDPYVVWRVRRELLGHFIEDDNERLEKIALALRHIARHRGWRNPYLLPNHLLELAKRPSDHYATLREKLLLRFDNSYQQLLSQRNELSAPPENKSDTNSLLKDQIKAVENQLSTRRHDILLAAGWHDEEQYDRKGNLKVDKETGEIETKLESPQTWSNQPYISQIACSLLFDPSHSSAPQHVSLRRAPKEDNTVQPIDARLGKLGQEDNLAEILAIFAMQRVSQDDVAPLLFGNRQYPVQRNGKQWVNTLGGVFSSVNPRDVGAAADYIAHDDLPGQERFVRASRASIAFQKYRIVASIQNLRIGGERLSNEQLNALLHGRRDEKGTHLNGLFELSSKEIEAISWKYVSTLLNVDRGLLRGMGKPLTYSDYNSTSGHWETRELDESVSAKVPPTITTEALLSSSKIPAITEFWNGLTRDEHSDDAQLSRKALIFKERFIDSLQSSGRTPPSNDLENDADREIDELIATKLNENELNELENLGMSLPSGRAAYSVDSLQKLSGTMITHNVDLHTARGIAFFGWNPNIPVGTDKENDRKRVANDRWTPSAAPLDEPTGSPSVDRTIKVVSRFLKACERRWGKPETVGIEIARDGFMSVSAARDAETQNQRMYESRKKAAQRILDSTSNRTGYSGRVEDVSNSDIRRIQAIQRQNGKCVYCGESISLTNCQMDHIVPRKGVGSTNTRANLVATCQACNLDKSNTLFSVWSTPGNNHRQINLTSVIKRINKEWQRDSQEFNARQWKKYTSDVIGRLKATEEDDPIDNRSIESVAWMGRELKARLEGRYQYTIGDLSTNPDEELHQRIFVQQGIITARARRIGHIENNLPWFGGTEGKTRLDRRHHAVDASVIALMTPAVAAVIYKGDNLRKEQRDFMIPIAWVKESVPDDYVLPENTARVSIAMSEEIFNAAIRHNPNIIGIVGQCYWRRYQGNNIEQREDGSRKQTDSNSKYQRWLDLMNTNHNQGGLVRLLRDGFIDGSIKVIRPVRRRLQNSKGHDDTVGRFIRKPLSDAWTLQELLRVGNYVWIDKKPFKITSADIYQTLTEHEDYNPDDIHDKNDKQISEARWTASTRVIPNNPSRRILINNHELCGTDRISIMMDGLKMDGSPIPVRGGYAAQGGAIHHARFYTWEDERGKTQYGMLRVYAADLLKAYGKKQNLFTCEIPSNSYSWRYANQKLRAAQHEGMLHPIGTAQQGDEVEVSRSELIAQGGGIAEAIKNFYTAENGQETVPFVVAGFEDPTRLKFKLSSLASEGLITDISKRAADINSKYTDVHRRQAELSGLVKKTTKMYRLQDSDWESKKMAILSKEVESTIDTINKQVSGYWRPRVNSLFNLGFRLNIRDAFGDIRSQWSSPGNMPVSWQWKFENENEKL